MQRMTALEKEMPNFDTDDLVRMKEEVLGGEFERCGTAWESLKRRFSPSAEPLLGTKKRPTKRVIR